jgi:hypothetical protein
MAHTFDSLKHAMKVLLNHLRMEYELLIFDGKRIGNRQLSVSIFNMRHIEWRGLIVRFRN